MADEQFIEMRFTGGNIRPELVRAADLGDVLRAVEEILESVALAEQLLPDALLLTSLTSIRSSSVDLLFAPSNPSAGFQAWKVATGVIDARAFQRLPRRATRGVRRIVDFTKTYDCVSEFRVSTSDYVLATLTPELIVADAPLIKGETVLYGQVIRVGGRKPKVLIAASDHSGTSSWQVNQEIARTLGSRLYTDIAVAGMATWNAETLKLEAFQITELLSYRKMPITEAFKQLSDKYGQYFDKLDPDEFIASVRGGKEE
jgi:hypothetical protein